MEFLILEDLDELILSIIDEGLSLLGDNPKKMMWLMLENEYGFSRPNIPKDLTGFLATLQSIFGLGYSFLDSVFKTLLQKAVSDKLNEAGSFAECINYLRRNQVSSVSTTKVSFSILDNCLAKDNST